MTLLVLQVLAACAPPPAAPPCEEVGEPSLELAPSDMDFGAFTDGGPLYYGTPPQGGAPYSPFHARATGLDGLDDGAHVRLRATDQDDGSALGDISYDVKFVCANVGDSAGSWVGSDLHLRFEGWELEDLEARRAEIRLDVGNLDGEGLDTHIAGILSPMATGGTGG